MVKPGLEYNRTIKVNVGRFINFTEKILTDFKKKPSKLKLDAFLKQEFEKPFNKLYKGVYTALINAKLEIIRADKAHRGKRLSSPDYQERLADKTSIRNAAREDLELLLGLSDSVIEAEYLAEIEGIDIPEWVRHFVTMFNKVNRRKTIIAFEFSNVMKKYGESPLPRLLGIVRTLSSSADAKFIEAATEGGNLMKKLKEDDLHVNPEYYELLLKGERARQFHELVESDCLLFDKLEDTMRDLKEEIDGIVRIKSEEPRRKGSASQRWGEILKTSRGESRR